MLTLLIATRNDHKVGEIRAILSERFNYLTLRDFPGAPNVVEDAPTFAGNATKKAVELAEGLASEPLSDGKTGSPLFVLADDSGLEVDALNGAPGVHSARFAAQDAKLSGNTTDADNNAKLLRLLREVPAGRRKARFRCVLALTQVFALSTSSVGVVNEADHQTRLFDGVCEGQIGFELSGAGGFGYDPLFIPTGLQQTFAELGDAAKNQLSHRAKALEKLRHYLDSVPGR
jgi:XTP/dITP diphosphohydrolase